MNCRRADEFRAAGMSTCSWSSLQDTSSSQQRGTYLASCVEIVDQARKTAGCVNFAISADLNDPGRVNIFERWESQVAVEAFRADGPSTEQSAAMLSASVAEYDVTEARDLVTRR